MTVNQLPDVGRIHDATAEGEQDHLPQTVVVQYTDHKGGLHELRIPFLESMYLLNFLKRIQLDVGYQMPDEPRQ